MSTSVRCAAVCSFNDILRKWSRVDQPHYVGTDFPYLTGAWNMAEVDATGGADRRDMIDVSPAGECICLKDVWLIADPTGQTVGTGLYQYPRMEQWIDVRTGTDAPFSTLSNPGLTYTAYTMSTHPTYIVGLSGMYEDSGKHYVNQSAAYSKTSFTGITCNGGLSVGVWDGLTSNAVKTGHESDLGNVDYYHAYRFAIGDTSSNDNELYWIEVANLPSRTGSVISYRVASINDLCAEYATDFESCEWHRVGNVHYIYGNPTIRIVGGNIVITGGTVSANGCIVPTEMMVDPESFAIRSPQNAYAFSCIMMCMKCPTGWLDVATFRNTYFQAQFQLQKFYNQGIWESSDHQLGFTPLNNPTFTIDTAGTLPPGTSATCTLIDPVTAKYQLTLNGGTEEIPWGPYSLVSFTPTVRAVNYSYAMLSRQYWGSPTVLQPEQLSIEHNFDYNSLQIHSHASMTFNNNRGQFSSFFNNAGQNAVDIGIESSHIMPGIQMQAFSGIGNRVSSMRGAHGSSMFTMECFDRSCQLENPRWALPWMDGWNEFYAQYYLSQLGGIHPDQMGYSNFIPPDPFNVDLGDEYGNPAWYLPVGAAGTALTRFSGVNIWEIKSRLAFAAGKLLFFDAYGREQYRKFLGPATFVKRTFFEDDTSGYPLGCHTLSLHRSLEDVRNQVTVVGVDAFGPLWNPIVSHYSDDASINDPNAFNHIGYSQPIVWADSMFANAAFAQAAAQRLISFLRLPTLHVHFTTWLNPDIYPLDTIGVDAPRFGIAGLRFMVVSVNHHLDEGSFGSTSITARWMGN